MFAWALEARADDVRAAMRLEFARHDVRIDDWTVPIDSPGARVLATA